MTYRLRFLPSRILHGLYKIHRHGPAACHSLIELRTENRSKDYENKIENMTKKQNTFPCII